MKRYGRFSIGFLVLLVLFMSFGLGSERLAAGKVFSGTVVKEGSPEARELMGLAPIKGPKKLIGVGTFDNKSNYYGTWVLGDGMAEMLTTALVKTGRFIVVERPQLGNVIGEQDLAASGRTTAEGGAKTGGIYRAQIIVSGAITEFSHTTEESGIGIVTQEFGAGVKVAKAHVAVNIRMYDTTTSEVIYSERVDSKVQRSSIAAAYTGSDFAIGGSQFKETPLGEATHEVIEKAVFIIANKMNSITWKGTVVMVKPEQNQVYINCGKNCAVKPGYKFTVYSKGLAIVDPETGITLGVEETEAGTISVVKVQDRYSVCTMDELVPEAEIKRGDIVKFE